MLATLAAHFYGVLPLFPIKSLCCQDIHDKTFQCICKELLSLAVVVLWVCSLILSALLTTYITHMVSILLSTAYNLDALAFVKSRITNIFSFAQLYNIFSMHRIK